MSFIARQPNGLLCEFSTVLNRPTLENMTESDYIEMCAERAREDAKDTIRNHVHLFSEVTERFGPNSMTKKDFKDWVEKVKK